MFPSSGFSIVAYIKATHRQTTGRHDDSPTVFFSPTADLPTRPVTDTTSHRQKLKKTKKQKTKKKKQQQKKKKKSPRHSTTLTDSYYSWKMNERKSFCQPQNQFIRQSRQKDTKRRNNILFQASFRYLKLLKKNCIQFWDSRSAKLYIKPSSLRFWDYGHWLWSLDVWISFSCLTTLPLQSGRWQIQKDLYPRTRSNLCISIETQLI